MEIDMPIKSYIKANYVEKKKIEEKIKEYNKLIENCVDDEEHYGEIPLYEHDISVLQELLEE